VEKSANFNAAAPSFGGKELSLWKDAQGLGLRTIRRRYPLQFVAVGWLLRALFLEQRADALAYRLVRDGLQQPLEVLDVQALNKPIHDAPPRIYFPRCDYFRDFHSATWTKWESAPDVGFESNAIARHHTQLKMANRR
jgi:hypothetical protein